MEAFLNELQDQGRAVEVIVEKIEDGRAYMEELKACLPMLNQTVMALFGMIQDPASQIDVNQDFLLQVLGDILYGMEKEDPVYLADVLRYGLLEVYDYIGEELQRGGHHEQAGL